MMNRHTREMAKLRALLNAAADTRLPDKQLARERWRTFVAFFQPSVAKREGYKRLVAHDSQRRKDAKRAALEDGQVVLNRAMRRALGERGYGFGLGRMDIPRRRA